MKLNNQLHPKGAGEFFQVDLAQDNTGDYFTPAVDTSGYGNAIIYVSSSQYADVTVYTSTDGMTWTTLGTMGVEGNGRSAYSMAITTKFVRWKVDTDGTPKTSIALIQEGL